MAEDVLCLVLKNQLSEIQRMVQSVEKFAQDHGLSSRALFDMTLALEEIVTNVVSYGFEDNREHEIIVWLNLKNGLLTASIEDEGRPFNPLNAPEPDTDAPLDERPIGGLGIHLVRMMMDDLEYRRQNSRNIIVMRKKTAES